MKLKPYPDYRDSGLPWFGMIPAHWTLNRLKATVSSLVSGVWGNDPDGENDVICVRVADFDRHALTVRVTRPTYRAVLDSQRRGRMLASGDLLLEKSGGGDSQPVGVVVLYGHSVPAVCSNFVSRMLAAPGYDPRYLTYMHYCLYSARLNSRSIKQTTGIQNLDISSYLGEHFGFPALSEQTQIARFLDHYDRLIRRFIRAKRRQIELLNEEKQAIIQQAVTRGLDPNVRLEPSGVEWLGEVPEHWKISRLKFEASDIVDCLHATPHYEPDGEFPAIRTADISPGRISLASARRVNQEEYDLWTNRLVPRSNDILYSREGERFGIAARVPNSAKLCISQRMMVFRIRPCHNSEYFMWQLNCQQIYAQAAADVIGATSPHVNIDRIKNYWVVVPPCPEQDAIAQGIVDDCRDIESTICRLRREIDLVREYRTRLFADVVTGKLDVRDAELPQLHEANDSDELFLEGIGDQDAVSEEEDDLQNVEAT